MTLMETGKHKWFNETMETTQDVKAKFHKEIEPLKKTQTELKREMKTFRDQMKAPRQPSRQIETQKTEVQVLKTK